MVALLHKGNRGLFAADADLQPRAARVDRQIPITQPPHEVEGRPRRLRLRQAQRIGRHCRLDRRTHLGRGTEEAVSRSEALQGLVRALEVVVLHEQQHPPLAVLEVGEHRAREQFLPQRLSTELES